MVPICDGSFADRIKFQYVSFKLSHEVWDRVHCFQTNLILYSKHKKSDSVNFCLNNGWLTMNTRVNSKPVRIYTSDVLSIGQVLTLENPLILDLVNKESRLALDEEAADLTKRLNRVEEARKRLDTDWSFKPKQSKRRKKK